MRADLAPIGLTAGYCFAGLGVLAALRYIHLSIRNILATLGLAFFVGVAVVLLCAIALLCAGAPVNLATLGVLAILIGMGGLAAGWRQTALTRPRLPSWQRIQSLVSARTSRTGASAVRRAGAECWLAGGVVVALTIFAVLTYRWAQLQPLQAWDSWSIWARKAILLTEYDHLPTVFLTSPAYAFAHSDYPLLIPLYESSWFRAIGNSDTQSLHVWFWILFVAFLWSTAYVASRVVRPVIWAPIVGLVAVIPAIRTQLMTMYADVPMGLFLMLGVLLLGLWLARKRRRDLGLSVILLAAAASTKNEGLTAATSAWAAILIVTLVAPQSPATRLKAVTPLLVATVAFAALIAPWRLWQFAHHITSEIPVGHGLNPSFLLERTDRIQPTVHAMFAEVTNQGNWYYVLPIGLALIIAGLATSDVRRIAAFYGLATLTAATTVLWAYIISGAEITWLITTSADRTVVGPMMILTAGIIHIAGALLATSTRRIVEDDPLLAPSTTQIASARMQRCEVRQ